MKTCTKCNSKNIKTETYCKFHDLFYCLDCNYWTYQPINDCCRHPLKMIVIDRKNEDLYFIREQCYNCGGCRNKSRPLSSKIYGDLIRGELLEYREKERWDIYNEEKNTLSSLKDQYRYHNSFWYLYDLYLRSDTWKQKRKLVFERDKNTCKVCNVETATEVHHLTYKNIYNEELEDLIAICYDCHKKQHNKPTSEEINRETST